MSGIPDWFLGLFNSSTTPANNGAPADASVSLTVDHLSPVLGETVTFTVTAGNNGPGEADGIGITVPLGRAFRFSAASTAQGSYDPNTGIWSVGTIASGASATLTISATVVGSGWNLVTAKISGSSTLDANNGNNVAYAGVAVPPPGITSLVNTQSSSDGSVFPDAVEGEYNQQIVTNQAQGATVLLARGYQTAVLAGSAGAALVDTGIGNALLVGGIGNDTVMSTISGDTLRGGDGDNVLVSFSTGTATMDNSGTTGNNLFWGNGAVTVNGGSGNDTAVMLGGGVINTGTGGSQVWLSTGTTVVNSNGADTIIGGSGAETINVLSGSGVLAFGGTGHILFNGGAGASTLVGLNSSVTVNGGTGGGTFFGGSAGHNLLNSGSGQVNLFGAGDGDTLVATGSASDVLVASYGAETLSASGSTGSIAIFGGYGADVMIGGTGVNAITSGLGEMTMVGGGSADLFNFLAGAVSDTVIEGFNANHDYVKLTGFSGSADQAAYGTLQDTAAGAVMKLGDGTFITFAGVSTAMLTPHNFI